MKPTVTLATPYELGVSASFSRPRVSNRNAYIEALFRTARRCAQWLEQPFDTLDEARVWANCFVAQYNPMSTALHAHLRHAEPALRRSRQPLTRRAGRSL